jgi:O-antigen ligase
MRIRVLQLLIFLSIGQLGILVPGLEAYRPFFVVSVLTGLVWMLTRHSGPPFSHRNIIPRLVCFLAFFEVLPALLALDLILFLDLASSWVKIVLIFLFVYGLISSPAEIQKVLAASLAGVFIVIVYAHWIYLYSPQDMFEGRLGSFGMYRGANDYGLLLTLSIPLILKKVERPSALLKRLFFLGLLCVCIWHVFLTGSRGSLIGTAVVVSLGLWTSSIATTPGIRKLIVAAAIAGIVVIGAHQLSTLREESSSMVGGDDSAEARLDAWAACGRMLLANPFGVGFDQAREHIKDYDMYAKIHPHNTYVKVAAEAGFLGFFCYSAIFYFVISRLMKLEYHFRFVAPDERVNLIQALLFALVGFIINTSFSQKEYEWFLYVLLGCSARLIDFESEAINGI